MLNREFGDIFVLAGAQNQNGNLRRDTKEPVKRADAVAVGEKEIGQHGRNGVRTVLLLLAGARQALEPVDAVPDPFDLERATARCNEGVANRCGVRKIVLNKEDVLRHESLLSVKTRLRYSSTPNAHRLYAIEHKKLNSLLNLAL